MLVTIVLVFLFCWGPKLIFNVIKYSDQGQYMHTQIHFKLQVILHQLNMSLCRNMQLLAYTVTTLMARSPIARLAYNTRFWVPMVRYMRLL